jgi:D-3-phosphoglycerate dehydrogenase
MQWRETKTTAAQDYINLVTLRGGDHAVAGTLAGARGDARIVMVDEHAVELPPARHLLVVRNDDRPGMIGVVGTVLGDAGCNIQNMAIGQSPGGDTALMILSTEQSVPAETLGRLRATEGILDVHALNGAS